MIKSFKKRIGALVTVGPTVLWLGFFLMIPLIYVIGMSFLTKNAYGGVDFKLTLSNYAALFSSEYVKVFADSLWLSLETTVICLIVGYPFAYIIANAPKKWKPSLVLLLMLPFWTNSLIRTYGWNTLLRTEGIINHFLQWIGLTDRPLEMLYTDGAVLLGMVYALLPFTVLPLHTSIEKLDKSLLEASSDLGASRVHTFTRVILPLTMPGIFAGSIQTFIREDHVHRQPDQEPVPLGQKLAPGRGALHRADRDHTDSDAAVHAGRKSGRHGVGKVNSAEGGREGTLGCNEPCEGRKKLAQLISKRGRSR